MPTYDYECTTCRHTFETFQSMKADPLTDCPSCGASDLRRVISGGTGVIFKGSGFYVNDSRGSSKTTAGESGGAETGAAKTESGAKPKDGAKTDGAAGKEPTPTAASNTGGSSGDTTSKTS